MNKTDKQLEKLRAFVADFAAEKIDALPTPHVKHPADEFDPVVDAETVWAWQSDAANLLKELEALK